MSNSITYDANKHEVDTVTVFQSNRAEVNRKIKVELKSGQNDVEVKNLPTCLEEDSIRVDGVGNAVIFDVIYHPPPAVDHKKHGDLLGGLNKRLAQLSSDLDIVNQQAEVLKDYSKTLTGKDTDANQLDAFLDVYSTRRRKVDEEAARLAAEIKRVDQEITGASVSVNADEESIRLRGVRITIVVLGEGDGEAELSLTYVVSNAWWKPQYDLRAFIAHDDKTDSRVNLHYRASIVQNTGENWSEVALKLSTASPLQGTTIPVLHPYWIEEYEPPRPKSKSMGGSFMKRSSSVAPQAQLSRLSYRAAAVEDFDALPPPPGFFSGRAAIATEGAISATFNIPGQSSIPSGSSNSSQTHKVSISEIAMSSVDLEWITVPKDIASAFLQCKVKNTSQFILLPGSANIFMNNNFVAKSSIPHVSPQETFSCSLGVDPAVRVTYHPQSKKIKTAGSVLSAKTTTTTCEQRITIKNTRLTSIPRLLVKDHIPLSRDARIKVVLLEPRELSQNKTGTVKGTQVKEGIAARWVPQNEDDNEKEDGRDDSARGLVEWICDIGAGATVDLNLAWDVGAPAGLSWVKQ